jgi:dolichol-phosphate mannosyltransferase
LKGELDVSIILPTYNEAGNIERIVVEISKVFADSGLTGETIVVDDDSADGTAGIVAELSRHYGVRLFVRKDQRGLATAVLKGFELAQGRVCLVMDADLSHPVGSVPDMVRPILKGDCDMTVGSRYVAGGGAQDWPFVRRIISKGSGLLARGVTKLSDPTSGFMAIRRSLLVDAHLDPVGWKIVLETAVKLDPKVIEIPIVFADRYQGQSKLSLSVQYDYLRHLWRLYRYKYETATQFVQFSGVGISGIVIDTVVLMICVELLKLDPRLAAVFAFLVAATWNYNLNRLWTFDGFRKTIYSYVTFVIVACVGLGIRIGSMHILIEYSGMGAGRLYVLASIIGILLASIVNFLGSKYISFSKNRNVWGNE